jgi:hypothetical protein
MGWGFDAQPFARRLGLVSMIVVGAQITVGFELATAFVLPGAGSGLSVAIASALATAPAMAAIE